MPHRVLVANELAEMLGVLAHPNRILIIEELRDGEHDVNSLQAVLGIWSITDSWVMQATIRMVPQHVGQASGSTSPSRRRRYRR